MILYHNLDAAAHLFVLFASLVVQLQCFLNSKIGDKYDVSTLKSRPTWRPPH